MNIKNMAISTEVSGLDGGLLRTLSGIYLTLHVIDLDKMVVYEYATTDNVHRLLHGDAPLEMRVRRVMDGVVVREQRASAFEFSDLGTIGQRLRDRDVIRMEFVSIFHGWFEASFIVMRRDENGFPNWVVFATRLINERKEREENLRRWSNTDEVTGFLNRRAYEEVLADHAGTLPADNFVFVAFDVNGLKEVNDSLGHSAGDELLRGAADCINSCFGKYGRVFRTGGDEFVALIYVDPNRILDIGFAFEKRMATWHGTLVKELSISWGSASRRDNPRYTMQELARVADRVMYKAKEKYYTQNGLDRRAQRTAYDAICSTYVKALQVDLVEESCFILQMDGLERDERHGFNERFSVWMRDFAITGGVHEDDREEFFEKLQLDRLRQYFRAGNKSLRFFYRRNIRGQYKPVMLELIAAPEYSAEKQLAFLLVKDIEK